MSDSTCYGSCIKMHEYFKNPVFMHFDVIVAKFKVCFSSALRKLLITEGLYPKEAHLIERLLLSSLDTDREFR